MINKKITEWGDREWRDKQLINTVHNICIIVIIFSIIINIHKNIDKNPSLFKFKTFSGFSFFLFLYVCLFDSSNS